MGITLDDDLRSFIIFFMVKALPKREYASLVKGREKGRVEQARKIRERNAQIVGLYESGMSYREIGIKMDISKQRVWQIVTKFRK